MSMVELFIRLKTVRFCGKGYTSEIVFSDCIIEPQNRIENQKILKGEFYETVKAEYSSISSDIAIEDRCGDEIFLDLGILQNQCQ